jgi:hypothetical protein
MEFRAIHPNTSTERDFSLCEINGVEYLSQRLTSGSWRLLGTRYPDGTVRPSMEFGDLEADKYGRKGTAVAIIAAILEQAPKRV